MSKQPDSYAIVLAEDVRAEADGKFTLVGIFSGGFSLQRITGEDFGLSSISAYSEFYNIHDSYSIKISVRDPAGEVVAQADVPNSGGEPEDKTMTLAGKFQGLKFKMSGTYELVISLDDTHYIKTFNIDLHD